MEISLICVKDPEWDFDQI